MHSIQYWQHVKCCFNHEKQPELVQELSRHLRVLLSLWIKPPVERFPHGKGKSFPDYYPISGFPLAPGGPGDHARAEHSFWDSLPLNKTWRCCRELSPTFEVFLLFPLPSWVAALNYFICNLSIGLCYLLISSSKIIVLAPWEAERLCHMVHVLEEGRSHGWRLL